jgi:hypothetical protein
MKIICVEEHAIDAAKGKAARPAVLDEEPYSGLMDSPNAGRSTARTSRWTAPVNSSGNSWSAPKTGKDRALERRETVHAVR